MNMAEPITEQDETADDPANVDLSAAQIKTLAGVPDSLKPTFIRAFQGSKAAAIKSFCLSCVGFVKKDITRCTAAGCPLYPHRPYKGGADE